ncbi:efflux RND transporter periplasmic adaptor subunit [Geomesophilobacter sediminis]|uniref:Efflux RND transporter periplasmic adaptor subunit n=1 Tax=Geomesophilobacter sediminis TaxID=2798584 RepID=A0A8J7LYH5_9BACT|nr:efflux RND transporter periplasmic adaptor subunit [Geomesophilobacter sediminis]MBJ6725086.1 efflux RND transporter periplasmic adaptor subunit [Geomesophilobacter sediminis]
MSKSFRSAIRAACLSVLGMALAACSESQKKASNSDPVPVTVGRVQKAQEQETISVSGTVTTPNAPANVSFLVSGKVVFVGPREGDFVKKGEVLARIDPTDFNLSVQGAAAQVANAQAAMGKAVHSARPELLEQARIVFERAEDEYRRMKMLYDSKSMAPNDFLKYKAAYERAKQEYEQAKMGGQQEDKELARAAYSGAMAHLQVARKALSDATLVAPTSGYIAKRAIEPGDTAAAGRPVFEIVQMDPVEVNVGVPETDVHRVRVGQQADVAVPALPQKSFSGKLRVINVSADPSTRTYMTRIVVPNPDHALRVGMVAEATIRGDRTVNMVTLPGDAVIRDPQGATQVFVYYPDQKRVYAKRVEVGAVVNRNVEIKSGLSGNESIVLAGQSKLRNGLIVSATEQQTDRK